MSYYDDSSDHPFAVHMKTEASWNHGNGPWLRWITRAEKALGVDSLDRDQAIDGYSLDYAYEAFKNGLSAVEYAASIRNWLRSGG